MNITNTTKEVCVGTLNLSNIEMFWVGVGFALILFFVIWLVKKATTDWRGDP